MLVLCDAYIVDFWVNNDNVWIAVVLFDLRLAVSEGPRDGEASRYDSHGSASDWTAGTREHYVLILVDLPASFEYPLLLALL